MLDNSVNRLKVCLETQQKKSSKNEKTFWNEFAFRYFPKSIQVVVTEGGGLGREIRALLTFFTLILRLGWLSEVLMTWRVGRREDILILMCSSLGVAMPMWPS